MTFRKFILTAAVASALAVAGFGAYFYIHSNSAGQLAAKATIALEQHDPAKATEYLQRALAKHPTGETRQNLKVLMARALLEQQRDNDARDYLQQVLAEKPDHFDALELLVRTYVQPSYDALRQAFKPVSGSGATALYQTIQNGLDGLANLPATGPGAQAGPASARNLAAQAELHRLYYLILTDQENQATADLYTAQMDAKEDQARTAARQLEANKGPAEEHRQASIDKLEAALKADAKYPGAGGRLADYLFQDGQLARVHMLYAQLQKNGTVDEDVILAESRALLADTQRQPSRAQRLSDAQQGLEAFLKDHAKSARAEVALGDVLLEENHPDQAFKLAQRAAADDAAAAGAAGTGGLSAQVLMVDCRLRENKVDEALRLINPLTTSDPGRPEVWYLLGTADAAGGDSAGAQNAFRKALAVNPGYLQAREALLVQEIKAHDESASATAALVLRDNRYSMPAWGVLLDGMRRRGQADRARDLLVQLARDPQLPADYRGELARMLMLSGAPAEAEKLLASMPADDPTTLPLRAAAASAAGQLSTARELFTQAIAAAPDDVDLRLQFAGLLVQSAMPADARTQLDAAAGKSLSGASALALARAYLQLRLPAQATAVTQTVLDKSPQNSDARAVFNEAQAMLAGTGTDPNNAGGANITVADATRNATAALDAHNFESALSSARAGLALDKTNTALHELAARALMGLKQPDQAVDEAVEAAKSQPNQVGPYATFVSLFSTSSDTALKGISYGAKLESVNPGFGNWAMGQLASDAGQYDLALKYFRTALEVSETAIDPRPARDQIYQSMLDVFARKKDSTALAANADALAKLDASFAPGIHLLAFDHLMNLGDAAAAQKQLEAVTSDLPKDGGVRLITNVAARWLRLGQLPRARQILEQQIAFAGQPQPELLESYAALLTQARDWPAALEQRNKLVKLDPANINDRLALAQTAAAAGDYGRAFHTLDDAAQLGETGRQAASAARVQMYISMGLLGAATQELQAHQSAPTKDDFASMLAVAQAWAQLGKPDEARKAAQAIPVYAAEYGSAQLLLAELQMDSGDAKGAVAALTDLLKRAGNGSAPGNAVQVKTVLFLAELRAGDSQSAIDLTRAELATAAEGSPAWHTWTTLAATAAREGRQYDQAIALLATDPQTKDSLDVALLELLKGDARAAAKSAETLDDQSPSFNRTTINLLAGKPDNQAADKFNNVLLSTAIAALAAMPADQRNGALDRLANNPRIIRGDVETLLRQVSDPNTLRDIALAQRLLEAGWSTAVLDRLASLKDAPALVNVMRHQALTDLHRTTEADALRDAIAARETSSDITPSERLLLAAAFAKQERFDDALNALQPLAALNRPDILTTLATFHERIGGGAQLEQAIALHRRVLKLDPENVAAMNNLAYTLATAHPADKAALEESFKLIQAAIAKAPQITAFQDTLGWVQILNGQAAEGTRHIAQAIESLRLDPAVHYHLGMGYLRTNQPELARLHLQNVALLARDRKNIPELPLADAALRELALNQ